MAPQLRILTNVTERLKNVHVPASGHLHGILSDNVLTVLTFTLNIPDDGEDESSTPVLFGMPTEIDCCGIIHVGECSEDIFDAFKDIDVTDNPLLLKCTTEGLLEPYLFIHEKLEPVVNVEMVTEKDISQWYTYICLQGDISLKTQNLNITDILEETRKNITAGNIGIHFPSDDLYLFDNNKSLKDIPLKNLLRETDKSKQQINHENSIKYLSTFIDCVPANMLFKISENKSADRNIKYAPVLHHIRRPFNGVKCTLDINTLSLVSRSLKFENLYNTLIESVSRSINLVEKFLIQQGIEKISTSLMLPKLVHFKPRTCGHLITVVYPADFTDKGTIAQRRALHRILALDTSRPNFRCGNAVKLPPESPEGQPLLNPHHAILKNPGSNLSLVDGLYAYHHYMQDSFDDNGWGCAYRSLQTIVSWYRLQGYTDIPIPSHKIIQTCLVDIGDKPYNFLGSKQWIGSTEVGYVLETLLGVQIKILRAASGEEVASYASDIFDHFQTQGTPIMIGGGVLAHTILGISYESSEVKYLILDPHYVGPDHLPTIINKEWCGWKTNNFWKKDSFYNLCLPQRPTCI